MENYTKVCRLVEILSAFYTEGTAVKEDIRFALTSEFLWNMQDVLFTKQIVSYSRFQKIFNEKCELKPETPDEYLRFVFYSCLHDGHVNLNIFERFLSALAIMIRLSMETRLRTGADFCKMVPVMFMAFYQEELKSPFVRRGGFRRFVQYINNPTYLESNCVQRNVSCLYDLNVSINEIPSNLLEKAWRMKREEKELPKISTDVENEMIDFSAFLASEVLDMTSPEFVPSLSKEGLNSFDSIQQSIAQPDGNKRTVETQVEGNSELTSKCCPSLNFPSETNDGASGQMADDSRYENIIEAVIRHNRSMSSSHKSNNRIQMEVDRILEHLKKTTISLIGTLEE